MRSPLLPALPATARRVEAMGARLLAAVALLLATEARAGDVLLTRFNDPELLELESVDGSVIATGLVSDPALWEVAAAPDGSLWGTDAKRLYRVTLEPPALELELVGDAGLPGGVSFRAVSFGPDGTLWAITNPDRFGGNWLWTVDTATGAATFVTGLPGVYQSLAVDGAGTLFAWRQGIHQLEILHPDTGAVTPLGSPGPSQDVQWLAFDACGTLLGGRQSLYTFDTTTGASTVVTFLGEQARSGTFLPQPLFQDLDVGGLAGSAGVPALVGTGALTPGAPTTVTLEGALPGAPAYVILGFSPAYLPVQGGVLVPRRDVVTGPWTVGPDGRVVLAFPWPALPPCFRSWWQGWVVDAAGPQGLAATDGLLSQSAP